MSISRSRGPPKLPVRQLAILAICRFAEPVSMTSVFPYLPEMIESFGVEKRDVAKWAGITSAVFSLAQCLTAILWGRASDRFGRKPAILIGLICTLLFSLMWGLSTNLPMAITSRAMAGAFNGNVGIIRTMVAEMVPQKELQPRAFTLMPLIWSLGSIIGPSLGGFFAKPAQNWPGVFGNNKFLIRFPFVLPNLIASGFFLIGITTGIFFLQETLETKRHRKDWGLVLGKRIVSFVRYLSPFHKATKHSRHHSTGEEASRLLPTSPRSSRAPDKYALSKPALPRPTFAEVFTHQSILYLAAYSTLSLHSTTSDQLLPIFLHRPRQDINAPEIHLPFKFSGGFDLASGRIGTLFTLYGVCGGVVQFLIFPPIARKYGVLRCYKICSIVFPFVYLMIPFTALIQDPILQQLVMFLIMLLKCFAVIFAFPCSTILLTNSATSLRILGTLNGFAVSISAIGRAVGPALTGATFTWGLERGYVITAWWLLSFVSVLGAVPLWFSIEMDGFSSSSTEANSDEEDEDDETPGEIEYLNGGGILDGDETAVGDSDEESFPQLNRVSSRSSPSHTQKISGEQGRKRKNSYSTGHHISSPIGIIGGTVGPGGGRRLSNGLAASNFGHGTGGTSFN